MYAICQRQMTQMLDARGDLVVVVPIIVTLRLYYRTG